MHECKWCDKEIEEDQEFCSRLCRETYRVAKEHDDYIEGGQPDYLNNPPCTSNDRY